MSPTAIAGTVLDHVAHAVPRWQDVWDTYAVDFGATWSSGGPGSGFAPAQLRFGNGARVEVLMPNAPETNDFLVRFLAHSGPGPHHLTFKVPDLADAIDRVRAGGLELIGINRSDPEWMEAFIHPKQETGVVVQIAEQATAWSSPPPDDFPTATRLRRHGEGPVAPALLRRVTHAVTDLGTAVSLFVDLLAGEVVSEGTADGLRWVEVDWAGPLGIRLVSHAGSATPGPLSEWLSGRTGRIHHLEFEAEDPGGISGTHPAGPTSIGSVVHGGPFGSWEMDPDVNAGLRLVIRPTP